MENDETLSCRKEADSLRNRLASAQNQTRDLRHKMGNLALWSIALIVIAFVTGYVVATTIAYGVPW